MNFPANPNEKLGDHLEFADEFAGTNLDRTKWFPHMLPHWSSMAAAGRIDRGVIGLESGGWVVLRRCCR